jgi:hypothetical protein
MAQAGDGEERVSDAEGRSIDDAVSEEKGDLHTR